jgi:hypothetical protein
MTLKITLNSGKVIYPSYDPEHTQKVLEYYQRELEDFGIQAYEVITN